MLADRGLAEETAQDAFVRIWKSLAGFRGDSALSTWVYAITRNACLTTLSSRRKLRDLSLDIPEIRHAAECAAHPPSPPDHRPDLHHLIAGLPENWRQVVLLFHMEEKSYDEVAAMLDLPLGTVKTYLHRARRQMAEQIATANQPTILGRDK